MDALAAAFQDQALQLLGPYLGSASIYSTEVLSSLLKPGTTLLAFKPWRGWARAPLASSLPREVPLWRRATLPVCTTPEVWRAARARRGQAWEAASIARFSRRRWKASAPLSRAVCARRVARGLAEFGTSTR